MMSAVKIIAEEIASKGPLAIAGTKEILNYGRDHTIEESLNHVALWNAAMGISDEMSVAFEAKANKKDPEFDDLIPRTGKNILMVDIKDNYFLKKRAIFSRIFLKIYNHQD